MEYNVERMEEQKKNERGFPLIPHTPYSIHARQRGFTLLLAALVSSIVLAIGASIYQLAQKQYLLSSVGRDSQYAFYAADTAAECALYWDIRYRYFSTTTPPALTDPALVKCDDQELNATGRSSSYPQTMAFEFAPNGFCASVTVEKTVDPETLALRTVVHADGFSTPCETVETSPRALQRSVELNY